MNKMRLRVYTAEGSSWYIAGSFTFRNDSDDPASGWDDLLSSPHHVPYPGY